MAFALYDQKTKKLTVVSDEGDVTFEDIESVEPWDDEAEREFVRVMAEEMGGACSFQKKVSQMIENATTPTEGS